MEYANNATGAQSAAKLAQAGINMGAATAESASPQITLLGMIIERLSIIHRSLLEITAEQMAMIERLQGAPSTSCEEPEKSRPINNTAVGSLEERLQWIEQDCRKLYANQQQFNKIV